MTTPGPSGSFRSAESASARETDTSLLVDCKSGSGLAEVWSRSKGQFCFRITGTLGSLTLDLPEVYVIKGGSNQTIQATVTVDGKAETVPVRPNTWTSVGEGADPKSGPATLLEFRASA
jgi:hypothetical protein